MERGEPRDYTKARLKIPYEEELGVPLVLFNEVLDHMLSINRIFKKQENSSVRLKARTLLSACEKPTFDIHSNFTEKMFMEDTIKSEVSTSSLQAMIMDECHLRRARRVLLPDGGGRGQEDHGEQGGRDHVRQEEGVGGGLQQEDPQRDHRFRTW